MSKIRVAVIGCGLVGKRRAREAIRHPHSHLAMVVDVDHARREQLAQDYGCKPVEGWKSVIDDKSVDVVAVSTPSGYTAEIAQAALAAGKHVLAEKPPGRNLVEARQLAAAAHKAGRVLKIGFNHRYHPAVTHAHQLWSQGTVGHIINIRARYGHGGRPGYEKEWRGDPSLAGGGELTDQGAHIVDLIHWFCGLPTEAYCLLQTAVWPIHPLEDNAFGLLRLKSGAVATFHTSWTQWKNLFSFEIFGEHGTLAIEGLGGSYGCERLITAIRNPLGGVPAIKEETFDGPDPSWQLEWDDFVRAVIGQESYWGTPEDGVAAMLIIDALYRSARTGSPISVTST